MGDITGVYDNENNNNDITGVHESTGVREINENDDATHANEINTNENDENTNENENGYDVAHERGTINDNNTADDDDISIEMEDHDDNHVTIYNLNILEHMNTAQLNTDPETGIDALEDNWRNVTFHGYNLRP